MLTADEAATQVGVDKSTIARAIRAGRINANKNQFGAYEISPEELMKFRRRYSKPSEQQLSKDERFARIWKCLGAMMDEIAALEKDNGTLSAPSPRR